MCEIHAGQLIAQPQDEQYESVERQPDPDHEVGPSPAVQLADEVGPKERQRIGQHADRQLKRPELDEPRDADDVQHRQRAEKKARQHKKHPLSPLVQVM